MILCIVLGASGSGGVSNVVEMREKSEELWRKGETSSNRRGMLWKSDEKRGNLWKSVELMKLS